MTSLHRLVFPAFLVATLAGSASSQVRENWRRVFDFGTPYANDIANSIQVHPGGGYVVSGSTRSDPLVGAQTNPLVQRLDASGNVSWSQSFTGDPKGDIGYALAVGASGAIYSASSSNLLTGADVRLIKYDASGVQQWIAGPYGSPTLDEVVSPRAILIDASENVTFGCSIAGAAISTYDILVLSYDAAGAQRFATPINGPGGAGDTLYGLCRDTSGNFFVCGIMDSTAGAASLLGLAKLDANGVVQWTRAYDHSGPTTTQILYSVACDSLGNVYACGAAGTAPNSFASVLISYDPAGQFRWIRQLPGTGNSIATRLAIGPRDRICVLSNLGSATKLTKYDESGSFLWDQSWSTPGYAGSVPVDMVMDPNGDVTIAGVSALVGSPVQDAFVVQYAPWGAERWSKIVDHLGQSESVSDLLLGPDGSVTFTGTTRTYSLGSGFGPNDFLTVELGDQSQPFCFGDGFPTACPCGSGSPSDAQKGCLNSTGVGGSLFDTGEASIANDTLVLTAAPIPGPGLFFQGTARVAGGAGITFGDGLLCAGGTITRLGVVFPTGVTAAYPGGLNPNPIHVGGATSPGDVRHYQTWYRDAAAFCQPETFNLSAGLTVTWAP